MNSLFHLKNIARLNFVTRCFKSSQKVCQSVEQAIEGIKNGSTIMFGGFGLGGIPENLI